MREWKRGQAVKLRLMEFDYQQIMVSLGVSRSFIALSESKYIGSRIDGLKSQYKGSKGYLSESQKQEIYQWLKLPKRRNIS